MVLKRLVWVCHKFRLLSWNIYCWFVCLLISNAIDKSYSVYLHNQRSSSKNNLHLFLKWLSFTEPPLPHFITNWNWRCRFCFMLLPNPSGKPKPWMETLYPTWPAIILRTPIPLKEWGCLFVLAMSSEGNYQIIISLQ